MGTRRVVYRVGYREGGIPGYYPAVIPQIGIARTQPVALPGPPCPCRHSRPLPGALRTPAAPAPVVLEIWRDIGLNILKLVINPECRLK